jgi:hypothetical protein
MVQQHEHPAKRHKPILLQHDRFQLNGCSNPIEVQQDTRGGAVAASRALTGSSFNVSVPGLTATPNAMQFSPCTFCCAYSHNPSSKATASTVGMPAGQTPAHSKAQHYSESCPQAMTNDCCQHLPLMAEDMSMGLDEEEIEEIFQHELAAAAWDKDQMLSDTWLELDDLALLSPLLELPGGARAPWYEAQVELPGSASASWQETDSALPLPSPHQPQQLLRCSAVSSAERWHLDTRPGCQECVQERHRHSPGNLHDSSRTLLTGNMTSPQQRTGQCSAADAQFPPSNAALVRHHSREPCVPSVLDVPISPIGRLDRADRTEDRQQQALQQHCQHSADLPVILPPCAWHPGPCEAAVPTLHTTDPTPLLCSSSRSSVQQLQSKMRQLQADLSRIISLQAALASWHPDRAAALAHQVLTSNSFGAPHLLPDEVL